jgi:hypothetical protein
LVNSIKKKEGYCYSFFLLLLLYIYSCLSNLRFWSLTVLKSEPSNSTPLNTLSRSTYTYTTAKNKNKTKLCQTNRYIQKKKGLLVLYIYVCGATIVPLRLSRFIVLCVFLERVKRKYLRIEKKNWEKKKIGCMSKLIIIFIIAIIETQICSLFFFSL